MDQETLINIVLVVLFLLITTVVRAFKGRQLKARQQGKKAKKTGEPSKPSPFSFFQKIRERIQESLEEMERQVRQQRQQQEPELEPSDSTFWDDITEDEETGEESEKAHTYSRDHTLDPIRAMEPEFQLKDQEIKTPRPSQAVEPPTIHPYAHRPSLQQAVVWAEIIGRPISMRKSPYDFVQRDGLH